MSVPSSSKYSKTLLDRLRAAMAAIDADEAWMRERAYFRELNSYYMYDYYN